MCQGEESWEERPCQGPQTSPMFDGLQGGLRIQLDAQLLFIMEGDKVPWLVWLGGSSAGHRSTLCLTWTKFQAPRRKAGVPHKQYHLHSLATRATLVRKCGETALKCKFPDASQGPAVPAGLSGQHSHVNRIEKFLEMSYSFKKASLR